MRSRLSLLAFLTLGVGSWLACVGDDAGTTGGQGGLDQPCYANGTCGVSLACVAGTCKAEGAVPPSSTEAGAPPAAGTDAGADAAADAGPAKCEPLDVDEDSEVRCGGESCPEGQQCCQSGLALGCYTESFCDPADLIWSCESRSDCQYGGHQCCITGSAADGGSCAFGLEGATSECRPAAECEVPGSNFVACVGSEECAEGATCRPTVVKTKGGFTLTLRTCQAGDGDAG